MALDVMRRILDVIDFFPKPSEGFKLKCDVFNFVLKIALLYRERNVGKQE